MLDHTAQPTLGHAVAAFLARADLATQSRRSYTQTLNRIVAELGDDSPLAALDSDQLSGAIPLCQAGVRRSAGRFYCV